MPLDNEEFIRALNTLGKPVEVNLAGARSSDLGAAPTIGAVTTGEGTVPGAQPSGEGGGEGGFQQATGSSSGGSSDFLNTLLQALGLGRQAAGIIEQLGAQPQLSPQTGEFALSSPQLALQIAGGLGPVGAEALFGSMFSGTSPALSPNLGQFWLNQGFTAIDPSMASSAAMMADAASAPAQAAGGAAGGLGSALPVIGAALSAIPRVVSALSSDMDDQQKATAVAQSLSTPAAAAIVSSLVPSLAASGVGVVALPLAHLISGWIAGLSDMFGGPQNFDKYNEYQTLSGLVTDLSAEIQGATTESDLNAALSRYAGLVGVDDAGNVSIASKHLDVGDLGPRFTQMVARQRALIGAAERGDPYAQAVLQHQAQAYQRAQAARDSVSEVMSFLSDPTATTVPAAVDMTGLTQAQQDFVLRALGGPTNKQAIMRDVMRAISDPDYLARIAAERQSTDEWGNPIYNLYANVHG